MTAITATNCTHNATTSLSSPRAQVRDLVVLPVLLALVLTVVIFLAVIPEGMR